MQRITAIKDIYGMRTEIPLPILPNIFLAFCMSNRLDVKYHFRFYFLMCFATNGTTNWITSNTIHTQNPISHNTDGKIVT